MSNLDVAERAKAHGAQFSLRIVLEAKRAGLPVSLGFALVDKETGFKNVWGNDGEPNGGTSQLGWNVVSKSAYLAYKQRRGPHGGGGMQGVGPCQLTYYAFQDRADKLGGCWVARWNIRVAFEDLGALIRAHGERAGLARYNGSGPAADQYASSVLRLKDHWHKWLQ